MENIFADSGSIVSSDRYIHRKKVEKAITTRLLDNESYGSMGLVGMQRMGKSSVAHRILIGPKEFLLRERIMVLDLVMYNYSKPQLFFEAMVDKAYDVLEELDAITPKLERRYKRAKESSVEESGGERVRSFFQTIVSELNYRVICVIDEFDHVKKLFSDYPEGFFVLRELAYQPENKIGFLFLSRRLMAELEAGVGFDVSNFSGILIDSYLTTYSEEEMSTYFKILQSTGVPVNEKVKGSYRKITGNMPYWMDILSMHYVDDYKLGTAIDIEGVFEEHRDLFYREYNRLFKLLEDQNLLNALYQIILGPAGEDATPQNIKRLENYGVIVGNNGNSNAISDYFRDYMIMKEQSIDFYPLWNRTEKLLRKLAAKCYRDKYGDSWEEELISKYVKEGDDKRGHASGMGLGDYILSARDQVEKMKSNESLYEINANEVNIFDGSTTRGLVEMILVEYEKTFKDVFNMQVKDFKKMMIELADARNPYQHNNDNFIRSDIKQQIGISCNRLINIIENYMSNNE